MTKLRVPGHTLDEQEVLAEKFTAMVTDELTQVLEMFTALVKYQGLTAAGIPTTPEEVFAHWSATSEGVLADFTKDVYTSGADAIAKKVAASSLVPVGSGVPGLPASYSASYVAKATNKMKNMAPAMWQNIQSELVIGTAKGESIDKLADRVAHAGSVSISRAQLTARTEVVGASNYGSYDQASLLGDDEGVSKQWEATEDMRTRPDHQHADGQIVPLHSTFSVGGYSMLHPGDFTAPASEVCNCRCTIVYVFDDSKAPSLCPGGGSDCVTDPDKLPAVSSTPAITPGSHVPLSATPVPPAFVPSATMHLTDLPVTINSFVKGKIYNGLDWSALGSGKGEDLWKAFQSVKDLDVNAAGLTDLQMARLVDDIDGSGTAAQKAVQEFLNSPDGKKAVEDLAKSKVTPATPPATGGTATVPSFGADGDISGIALDAKLKIKGITLSDSTITSPNKAIWDTVLHIQNTWAGDSLNALQVLRVMDEQFAEYWGQTNAHWYETKMVKWAKTKPGKDYVSTAGYTPKWGSVGKIKKPSSFASPGTPKAAKVAMGKPTPELDSLPKLTWELQPSATFDEIQYSEAETFLNTANLTAEQRSGLYTYTTSEYRDINKWLRGTNSRISERLKKAAKTAQAGMRAAPRGMTLWRGTGPGQFGLGDHATFDDLKKLIGKKMQDEGFMSSSVGSRAAFDYNPVLLQIEAPKGSMMAFVDPISSHPGENEMLLAAGTKYEVLDVYPRGSQTVVRLRIIR